MDRLSKNDVDGLVNVLMKVEKISSEIMNDQMSDLNHGHLQSCLAKSAVKLGELRSEIRSALFAVGVQVG